MIFSYIEDWYITVFFFSKNSPEASRTVVVVVGIYSEQKRIYIHSIDQDGGISAFCVSKKEKNMNIVWWLV